MDFDYKKYSLENLENWLNDAMSAGEATPAEIYNTIKNVVEQQYYYHKHHTSQANELLALLNGNGIGHIKQYDDCVDKILSCDKDDTSPECKGAWDDFWEIGDPHHPMRVNSKGEVWIPDYVTKKDKVNKWVLPVQVDGLTGECYINLPDDLLEAANLKEGDQVEWINLNNGSFEMRKVNGVE